MGLLRIKTLTPEEETLARYAFDVSVYLKSKTRQKEVAI
jgi:hypothetical protein